MNIVLLAPHQDDEIISSFGLLHKFSKNNNVSIIFATNGDYYGKEIAQWRYKESVAALSLCNIPKQNIYYMGYADTGMPKERSFLYNLYQKELGELFPSTYSKYTYHPVGQKTVHSLFWGKEAEYTKCNFITDLICILFNLQPDLLILPSSYDFHGDHAGLSLFYNQYVMSHYSGMTYYYLIHTKNDLQWPKRNMHIWSKPTDIPDVCWKTRKCIALSNEVKERKKEAILCFKSQLPYSQDAFLLSFVKNEEIFIDC